MRRAVLTLGGTVAGLAALFSYRTQVPATAPAALTTSAPPSASTIQAKQATPKTATTPTARTATQRSAPAKAPPTAPTNAKPAGTPTKAVPANAVPANTGPAKPSGDFEGPEVNTQYGPVQVALTVSNGKVTASNDMQQPADSIGANAIPQLNREVIQVQSANIQAVSGTTSTSHGYQQSLRQAIDKTGP